MGIAPVPETFSKEILLVGRRTSPSVSFASWIRIPICFLRAGASCAQSQGPAKLDFTLKDMYGRDVKLSDYRGKVVLLNFWATWCPPCRAENPDIEEVYNEHKDIDGLVLLAPAIGESRDTVAGYMERTDLHYPVGSDPTTQISANYRVLGIPTHIFVDREGIVRDMRVGAMSKKTMEKKVALLAGSPNP